MRILPTRRTRLAAPVSLPKLFDDPVHATQTEAEYREARHRVLILGGGFGGIAAAKTLDGLVGPDVSVLVIDRDSDLLFTPLLWAVADGRVDANHITVPIRRLQRGRKFHLLHAEVERIDLDRREVQTSAGSRPYDTLIIALGSVTAIPDLPGLRRYARPFATPGDAIEFRNQLIEAVEVAHRTADPKERRAWLTFVVGGGGDTGIELAATIKTYLQSGLLRAFPWLTTEQPRVVIVGRADRLVPMSGPRTSKAVRQILEDEGIEVRTGTSITGVTADCVMTSEGEIPARTLFWAAGITAPEPVRELPVEHARNGAIIVDEQLRIPEYPEAFVIGDSAWASNPIDQSGVPPTAQAAEHQGRFVANLVARQLRGEEVTEPFAFQPKGHLALLGRRTGVAEVGRFVFTGLPAWFMWHAYYLWHIPSWRNRVRLIVDLLLALVLGRETSQLRLERRRPWHD